MYKFLILVLLLVSCANPKQNQEEQKSASNRFYPDSLFYNNEARVFNASGVKEALDSNIALNADLDLVDQLTDCLNLESKVLSAGYYSSFMHKDNIDAVVLLIKTMQSQYLVLASISNGSDIISCIQLTESQCDLVEQHEDSEEIWCDAKSSKTVSTNTIQVVHEFKKELDYGDRITSETDSVTKTYEITDIGKISLKSKDSIRLVID